MSALAPVAYKPSKPVGARSASGRFDVEQIDHNTWIYELEGAREEIDALYRNLLDPKLSPIEHREYWVELRELMTAAMRGRVIVEPGGMATVIRDVILELRPRLAPSRTIFGRSPRLLRLYYGEPETHDDCLLALRLATKAADENGLEEQDEDIELAIDRANRWQAAVS